MNYRSAFIRGAVLTTACGGIQYAYFRGQVSRVNNDNCGWMGMLVVEGAELAVLAASPIIGGLGGVSILAFSRMPKKQKMIFGFFAGMAVALTAAFQVGAREKKWTRIYS